MAAYEIFHVAVAPLDTVTADLVAGIAAVIAKPPYETKLLLSRKTPVIVAHSNTLQNAEQTAMELKELGLITTVFSDIDLRKPVRSFRAHILQFEAEEILGKDRSGQTSEIKSGDMFLVISGKMQTYTETDVTETKMEVNVKATLMTGIPILRKVKQNTKNAATETECFIRLYNHASAEPCLEILQYDFDYSCLGAEMTLSSLLNFNVLVTKVKEQFPLAISDNSLMGPPVMSRSNFDINCRLMYWYHRNLRSLTP